MRGVGLPSRSAQANANFFGFPECSWFSKRGSKCPNFPLVCVAPRSEPRLAPFAREPFLGLCRGMEANNMLLLPAKSVCCHEAPRQPEPDRPGVKGYRIGRVCHARHPLTNVVFRQRVRDPTAANGLAQPAQND